MQSKPSRPRDSLCRRSRTSAGLVWISALSLAGSLSACGPTAEGLTEADRQAIAAGIERQVKAAYDLSEGDAVTRLMSLYPRSGAVYSATGGRVTTTRDSLEAAVRQFWNYVGRNMKEPHWQWTQMKIDVLSPGAAVMTATYRVPHLTPQGHPHVIGGAWTAVFNKRDGNWVIVHEHLSDSPSP